jgi:hypothetical protein
MKASSRGYVGLLVGYPTTTTRLRNRKSGLRSVENELTISACSLSRSSLPLWGGPTLPVREATDHAFVKQEHWAAIGVVEEFDCYTEDAANETSAGTARARRRAFHRAVSGSTKTDQGCWNVEVW